MDYTHLEYLTIGAHIRTTSFSAKSSNGVFQQRFLSFAFCSSSSAILNFLLNLVSIHSPFSYPEPVGRVNSGCFPGTCAIAPKLACFCALPLHLFRRCCWERVAGAVSECNWLFSFEILLSFLLVCISESKEKMAELPAGFYRTELNKTVWEVPVRYQELSPIGTGAYGQVW